MCPSVFYLTSGLFPKGEKKLKGPSRRENINKEKGKSHLSLCLSSSGCILESCVNSEVGIV